METKKHFLNTLKLNVLKHLQFSISLINDHNNNNKEKYIPFILLAVHYRLFCSVELIVFSEVCKKPVAYGKIVNINILTSVQFSIDHLHKYIEIHLNYHLILLEVSHKNHLLNSHWIILPFLSNAYSLPMKK